MLSRLHRLFRFGSSVVTAVSLASRQNGLLHFVSKRAGLVNLFHRRVVDFVFNRLAGLRCRVEQVAMLNSTSRVFLIFFVWC